MISSLLWRQVIRNWQITRVRWTNNYDFVLFDLALSGDLTCAAQTCPICSNPINNLCSNHEIRSQVDNRVAGYIQFIFSNINSAKHLELIMLARIWEILLLVCHFQWKLFLLDGGHFVKMQEVIFRSVSAKCFSHSFTRMSWTRLIIKNLPGG